MTNPACARMRMFSVFRSVAGITIAAMLFFSGAQSSSAHEYKVGDIEIAHPWSRAIPKGAKVASGYMVITNHGNAPDRLVSITSEIAGMSEVHEMSVDANGVMTMRPLEQGIEIPAGGEVALTPGTFHIMFMELKSAPEEGVRFKGTLTFEVAGKVDVEFAVEKIGADMDHAAHTK